MLDFRKLMSQIQQIGKESLLDKLPNEDILVNATQVYESAKEAAVQFANRIESNAALVYWPAATPLEVFGHDYRVEKNTKPLTVVAVDGSQIMPSHHEVLSCYLLNVGITVISYGVEKPAVLESQPHLFHKPDDLYPLVNKRRIHIDELYVSLERNLLELKTLLERAIEAKSRDLPVIAFMDGSLLPWSVDKMPESYQQEFFQRFIGTLNEFQKEEIPVVGYISHSRSSDIVNCLRIWQCPYEKSDCRKNCGHLNEENFPCSTIWPLSDRQLLSGELERHKRTATFASGAVVSKIMPPQTQICLSYLHTGYEVARLEFPRWVFERKDLFELMFSAIAAQVEKGQGYPVSLSEAHHLAVIRGADRLKFFDLLARQLISLGLKRVSTSPKENRKRRGVV
ncbi:MAG: DNA double-strand break repair nuclease NurA [Candidatus Obscuribacterales bacterium]|nr:DNA double-strand break repair nuclease NurA [Candidatus Obscuribacterales bacterium]